MAGRLKSKAVVVSALLDDSAGLVLSRVSGGGGGADGAPDGLLRKDMLDMLESDVCMDVRARCSRDGRRRPRRSSTEPLSASIEKLSLCASSWRRSCDSRLIEAERVRRVGPAGGGGVEGEGEVG